MDDFVHDIMIKLRQNCERILIGLERSNNLTAYDQTRVHLKTSDVSADAEYQKIFKSFYRVRRSADWCKIYFGLLQREKYNQNLTFNIALEEMCRATGRIEPSFSSKLIATIRPDEPVYDSVVRKHLNIPNFYHHKSPNKKLAVVLQQYDRIQSFYANALPSDDFLHLRREFDRYLPQFVHFTPTKKLDILLWQCRSR